jgi:hypothetical protein
VIGRIAIAAAVASEGLAVYTIAEWFAAGYSSGEHHAIPAYAFVLIALLGFLVPRAAEWLDLRPRVAAAAIGVVAYTALYGTLRVQFAGDFALWDLSWIADFIRDPEMTLEGNSNILVGALLVVAVWARSVYRSSADIEPETLTRTVTIPFIVVTAVLVLSVYTERAGEVARGGAAYYVAALLALAFGQLSLSGASFGDLRAGSTVATLLLATLGAAAACVVAFWLVFGLVGPVVGPWLETAIFYGLAGILWPVAWLLDKVLGFILGGIGGFEPIEITPATLRDVAEREPSESSSPVERGGVYLTRVLMLVVALGGLALLVAWLTRLRRRARQPGLDGEAAGIGGALQEDLRSLFGSILRRPQPAAAGPPSTPARRLYIEVLARAATHGADRHSDETPAEFAPRLSEAFHSPITDEITAAFMQSRYAGREPDPRVVAELERRWRLIEQ